jgi:NAD(P)-dependent dehydrogenase (short-subunit alcohol dehydrogenase family)
LHFDEVIPMRVIVIGATGTIGKEVVKRLRNRHEILGASRTSADLAVDITSPDSIRHLLETIGPIDALVCVAGDARFEPMDAMTDGDYGVGLASKLMGQVNTARIASEYVRAGGSITLTSGAMSQIPIAGATSVSMVNAGVEGFVRAAALELPRGLRINAVSPQWSIETLKIFGMDPRWGVPAERIALGYEESVEGHQTGAVIEAGWRSDRSAAAASVAVA